MSKTEIRRNDDGTLDEVCAWGFVHLEQMDTGHWWLGINTADGRLIHVNLHARGKIAATAEDEGADELATPLLAAVNRAVAKNIRRINLNRRRLGLPLFAERSGARPGGGVRR